MRKNIEKWALFEFCGTAILIKNIILKGSSPIDRTKEKWLNF